MTTPLVLLPALLCDARLFAPITAALAAERSVSTADLTHAGDIATLARTVLERAPARFAVLGLSMGGYVAFEILRRAPERVTHLALCCTRAEPDAPEMAERRRALVERARREGLGPVARELAQTWLAAGAPARAALVEQVAAMAEAVGVDGFARQQEAILARPDSRPGLAAIACPTLIVAGRLDTLTPPAALETIAAAIPRADLAVLGGCGHLATLERPDLVVPLVRAWLARG